MSDLQDNQRGVLSAAQRKFLLRNFLKWFTIYLLLGGAVTAVFFQVGWMWGLGVLAVNGCILVGNIYVHTSDLWLQAVPKKITGTVAGKLLHSPTTYGWVKVARIRLRCDPQNWKKLQVGESYEVYYAAKSKWLLSFQRLDGQPQTSRADHRVMGT